MFDASSRVGSNLCPIFDPSKCKGPNGSVISTIIRVLKTAEPVKLLPKLEPVFLVFVSLANIVLTLSELKLEGSNDVTEF